MKVLLVHNRYRLRGGEDAVFDNEAALLERAGLSVERLVVSSESIVGKVAAARSALGAISNRAGAELVADAVARTRPDIAHFHNTFPLLSPRAVDMALRSGIPVVATLHNYRSICANALLLRDGRPCEECVGNSRLPAVIHRCYRGSAVGSLIVAETGRAFRRVVARGGASLQLVALTEFAKGRFLADGFDASQIVVKGNAAPDHGAGAENRTRRLVFAGRLSAEKGVDFIISIAARLRAEVVVMGDGPDRDALRRAAPANVKFTGLLTHPEVVDHIKQAAAVLVPSRWYEGFPMTVIDSFSTATPVVASRLGSLPELVEDGVTGLTLPPGDAGAWVNALNALLDSPEATRTMGRRARAVYLEKHSEEQNLHRLLDIYQGLTPGTRGKA